MRLNSSAANRTRPCHWTFCSGHRQWLCEKRMWCTKRSCETTMLIVFFFLQTTSVPLDSKRRALRCDSAGFGIHRRRARRRRRNGRYTPSLEGPDNNITWCMPVRRACKLQNRVESFSRNDCNLNGARTEQQSPLCNVVWKRTSCNVDGD